MTTLLVFGIILAVVAADNNAIPKEVLPDPAGAQLIFPHDTELYYSMRADLSTGASAPAGHITYFGIQGTLQVRTGQDEYVEFRLMPNGTFTTYNGDATPGRMPTRECVQLPLLGDPSKEPSKVIHLTHPFAVIYKRGKISEIKFDPMEPAWSKNMKRGIASQFQLDLEQFQFKTPSVFTSKEGGLWGGCSVENSVTEGWKENMIRLTKFIYPKNCPDKGFMWTDNLSLKDGPKAKLKSPVETSTERRYTLQQAEGKVLQIDKISSRSFTSFQEYFDKGEVYYQLVNQTFRLLSSHKEVFRPEGSLDSSSAATFDLTADLAAIDPELGSKPDFTLGRAKPEIPSIAKFMTQTLDKMAAHLDERPQVNTDPEKLHSHDLQLLLWHFRLFDYESLKAYTMEILRGTSYREETVRNIFMDLLPQLGTRAAVLVVKHLVVKDKVSKDQASNLLEELPFHMRYADANLLAECKELLQVDAEPKEDQEQDVRTEATLAFSSMVGKICSKPGACTPTLLDEYVKIFFERFRDSSDYDQQVLNVLALGNIGLGPVADYLEPLVLGTLSGDYCYRLRFLAATVAKSAFLAKGPEKVYSTFWPLLLDRKAHLELRVAALSILLESEPTSERYVTILWLLNGENNPQLYNFFYTSVKALANSDSPYFYKMSQAAKRMARFMSVPDSPREADTAHYIMKFPAFLTSSTESLLAQVTTIADPATGVGHLLYVNVIGYQYGRSFSLVSLYLRVEGLPDMLAAGWGMADETDISELTRLFQRLGIVPREQEQPHAELVFLTGGRSTFASVFNSTLLKLRNNMAEAMAMKVITSHRNLQMFILEESLQSSSINDMGLNVILDRAYPLLSSVRGNATVDKENPAKLQASINFDIRYRDQGSLLFRTYNPVSTLWHGITRHTTHEIYVPFRATAALDLQQKSFKLKFDWTQGEPMFSSVYHGRTQTLVGGDYPLVMKTMTDSCPTCIKDWRDVTAGPRRSAPLMRSKVLDSEVELEAALFECELPQTIEDWPTLFLNLLNHGKAGNGDILHLEGNCGLKVTAMPVGQASSLDVVFKLEPVFKKNNPTELERFGLRVVSTYRDQSDKPIKSWNANLMGEKSTNNHISTYGGKLKLTRKTDGEKNFMVCYKEEMSIPESVGSELPFDITAWDLLYDSSAPRPNTRTVALSWGEVDGSSESACPTGQHQLIISGTSRALERDLHAWPHAQCEAEKGQSKVYPATTTCGLAADYTYGDRNFTLSLKQNNVVPPKLRPWFKLPEILTMDYTTRSGHVDSVSLTTPEGSTKQFSLDPCHLSALEYVSMQFSHSHPFTGALGSFTRGLGRRCTLAGQRLLTFDNSSVEMTVSEKDTLMAGDCRKLPTFGVFVRKVSGAEGLAARVFILHESVEITPNAAGGEPTVTINHDADPDRRHISAVQSSSGSLVIRSSSMKVVQVSYTPSAITVRAPPELHGLMCGLCGDFDTVPDAPWYFKGPDGNRTTADQLLEAYTLSP